jgi:hypothetical protein
LLSDQLDGGLDGKMAKPSARLQERSHLDHETLLRMMAAMFTQRSPGTEQSIFRR